MNLIFLDTETNAIENPRLVQLAYKATTGEKENSLFKPPVEIGFGAMSITHITNEMVEHCPVFDESKSKYNLEQLLRDHVFVAHNAPFDALVLNNEGIQVEKTIDTLQVAKHVFDDLESYTLQFLRYYTGVYTDPALSQINPHDAESDVAVLELVFYYIFKIVQEKFNLENDLAITKMIELSSTPILLKRFNFGKYKDKNIADVAKTDIGYLRWLLNSELTNPKKDQNENLVHTLKQLVK